MPHYSRASKEKLASCHEDLQTLFNIVIKTCDCTILEGYRNKADQNAAVASGNSKVKYPHGKHNSSPSLAVDVSPYPINWKNLNRFYWFSGYALGIADRLFEEGKMKHRVRWGGDWNNNYDITDEKGLIDLVHFELILT